MVDDKTSIATRAWAARTRLFAAALTLVCPGPSQAGEYDSALLSEETGN